MFGMLILAICSLLSLRQIVSYVLPWDLILRKYSWSLFNMYFYHDVLWPVIKATKF